MARHSSDLSGGKPLGLTCGSPTKEVLPEGPLWRSEWWGGGGALEGGGQQRTPQSLHTANARVGVTELA